MAHKSQSAKTPAPVAPDRRRHPRYAILLKGSARHAGGAASFAVMASDISEGGLLLHTNSPQPIVADEILDLEFAPLLDGVSVTFRFRVAWTKDGLSPHLGRVTFGGFFVQASKADIEMILLPAIEANVFKELPDPY